MRFIYCSWHLKCTKSNLGDLSLGQLIYIHLYYQIIDFAPINRVLINGENETSITTFFIDEKIDCGKIILQEKIGLSENTTKLNFIIY